MKLFLEFIFFFIFKIKRDRIHKRDASDLQTLDERYVKKYMILRSIESKLASFQGDLMRIEIESALNGDGLKELVLSNQKINKIDFQNLSSINFNNLKHLGNLSNLTNFNPNKLF